MIRACVILPTYNEAANIPVIVPSIFRSGNEHGDAQLHVLVVDDSSPDGTADTVEELRSSYPNLHLLQGPKRGLGDAYKRGFSEALARLEPDLIFQMDADLQHEAAVIPEFIRWASRGYSLVIGSRFVPGGSTPGYSTLRRYQSLAGSLLIRTFRGIRGVRDCTSGYRCIQSRLLRSCDLGSLPSDGFTFQTQLLYELIRAGARVKEIPIRFGKREHGQSKLTVKDRLEFLKNLASLSDRNRI